MFCRWMSVSVRTKPLLKLLVPNHVAGSLVGRSGAAIQEIYEKTCGEICLSANRRYYPGTKERIVTISGEQNEINEINKVIMDKVQEEHQLFDVGELRRNSVRIVLTNSAARQLISQGDLPIQEFQIENSSKQQSSVLSCILETSTVSGEHLLNISGTKEQRIEACQKVIEKICNDPLYMQSASVDYGSEEREGSDFIKASVVVEMEIPNDLAGIVIGKKGKTIKDICSESGVARISLSKRGEFGPGISNRILTIVGDMDESYLAYKLVKKRLQEGFKFHET